MGKRLLISRSVRNRRKEGIEKIEQKRKGCRINGE